MRPTKKSTQDTGKSSKLAILITIRNTFKGILERKMPSFYTWHHDYFQRVLADKHKRLEPIMKLSRTSPQIRPLEPIHQFTYGAHNGR